MTDNASTGELVSKLSQEVSELIRDELRLAQVEVSGKAKKAGIGVGLLGTAGIITLYGVAVLIATAILALALVLDAWLAALIVGVVLMVVAGVAAVLGKNRVAEAAPPLPSDAIASVKQDVAAVKEGAHR
jgi:uncharacterized membrane protein YqjE